MNDPHPFTLVAWKQLALGRDIEAAQSSLPADHPRARAYKWLGELLTDYNRNHLDEHPSPKKVCAFFNQLYLALSLPANTAPNAAVSTLQALCIWLMDARPTHILGLTEVDAVLSNENQGLAAATQSFLHLDGNDVEWVRPCVTVLALALAFADKKYNNRTEVERTFQRVREAIENLASLLQAKVNANWFKTASSLAGAFGLDGFLSDQRVKLDNSKDSRSAFAFLLGSTGEILDSEIKKALVSPLRAQLDSLEGEVRTALASDATHGQQKRALRWLAKLISSFTTRHSSKEHVASHLVYDFFRETYTTLTLFFHHYSPSAAKRTFSTLRKSVEQVATKHNLHEHPELAHLAQEENGRFVWIGRKLDDLDGNDLQLVEPALDVVCAVFAALGTAERGGPQETFAHELSAASRQAAQFLELLKTKKRALISGWFTHADRMNLLPDFIDRLRKKYSADEGEDRAPFDLALSELQGDAGEAIKELKEEPQGSEVSSYWDRLRQDLYRVNAHGVVAFDERLISALINLVNQFEPIWRAGDLSLIIQNNGRITQAISALGWEVIKRREADEANDGANDDVEHSIGRRAAQRYRIKRKKFIKEANRNNF